MKPLLLLIASVAFAQDDQSAVRKLVGQYVAAREHTDAKATAALFTADADQLVSSGEWRRGRDEVVRGTMASSQATGGQRTIARIGLTRDADADRDDYRADVGRYWNIDGIDPRERPEAPPDLSP